MAHKNAVIDSLLQNSNLKLKFVAKTFWLRYVNPPSLFGFHYVNPTPTLQPDLTSEPNVDIEIHKHMCLYQNKYGYFFTLMPYNLRFPAINNKNLIFPAKFEK